MPAAIDKDDLTLGEGPIYGILALLNTCYLPSWASFKPDLLPGLVTEF